MKEENHTLVNRFLIVGFLDLRQLQFPIFATFMLIYLTTVAGNILVMATIYSNYILHTPMYFFLFHLSFIDLTYISIIIPPMLAHFFLEVTYMTLTECLLQIYFLGYLISTEILLLSVMAYDRHVAICSPLHYTIIMNDVVCTRMAAGCWAISSLDPIPHTVLISQLTFCGSHTINHFFCDVTATMKLSCTSTNNIEIFTYLIGAILVSLSFTLIITSYIKITTAILRIQSTEGRQKAFSTCVSHITVVILFMSSLCSTYMRPTSKYSMKESKILSLLYVVVTPLCNPIIYSLKNTEFKNVLWKKKNTSRIKEK